MAVVQHDHLVQVGETQLMLRQQGNPDGPSVLVLGGISGGRMVYHPDGSGWWQGLFRDTQLLDYDVWSLDYCGGTGDSQSDRIPNAVAEHAELIVGALHKRSKTHFHAIIGGSFGGCIGMVLAAHPKLVVERLVVAGAAHRPTAQAVMLRSLQRDFIRLSEQAGDVVQGTVLARALAMVSYRGAVGLDQRFSDAQQAIDYIHERASALVARDPERAKQLFTCFGPALDNFTIVPQTLTLPVLVIGFQDDFLAPPHLLEAFVAELPDCRGYKLVKTPDGHDGFILATSGYGVELNAFLEDV